MVIQYNGVGNTYITYSQPAQAPDGGAGPGSYEIRQGHYSRSVPRQQRVDDPHFRQAWEGLCKSMAALRRGQAATTYRLDPVHCVHAIEASHHDDAIRLSIFTQRCVTPPAADGSTSSQQERIIAIDLSCQGERIHFHTNNTADLRLVYDALRAGCHTFNVEFV